MVHVCCSTRCSAQLLCQQHELPLVLGGRRPILHCVFAHDVSPFPLNPDIFHLIRASSSRGPPHEKRLSSASPVLKISQIPLEFHLVGRDLSDDMYQIPYQIQPTRRNIQTASVLPLQYLKYT